MRKFGALLGVGVFIALTVNARGELGQAMSSREVVKQQLERMGVKIGYGAGRGRMVAVETQGFSLKGDDEADDELMIIEKYDFPDDEADDFETKRFKTLWKAYADGLLQIARYISQTTHQTGEIKENKLDAAAIGVSRVIKQDLEGVVTITTAESCDGKEYEFSVAVCQSEKKKRLNEAYRQGRRAETPGRYSLKEWIDNKSGTGIICPQSFVDNEGFLWSVAGVPVDLSAGRNSKEVALKTGKARRYAYEAAKRTIAVRVSAKVSANKSKSSMITFEKLREDEVVVKEKLNVEVLIMPMDEALLWGDPSQVRWFELERMSPLTGNPVRCVVAALRSGNGMGKPKQDTEKGGGQVQQGTAIDQAKKFIESKEWRTGREFLKTSRFAVAIGGAAFKYTPSMDGAAFAQKRNDAVRQALMESAMNVAFTYDCSGELRKNLSDGNSTMQRTYVGDEAGEKIVRGGISFCDDSDTVVDLRKQDFGWYVGLLSISAESSENERASVKKVKGYVKSKKPILGLKVERQFESIVDGVYQIAFVVTCDPKRGRDMVLSFANEKSRDEWGKLPLGQWIAEQDFGMVSGPRQYVDDKGYVWMIGIAPAAEGCRPFGSSLDGMAREYAAFGLDGDVKASYAISSLKGPSGEYSERKAEILYSAESSPTGKYYPKEFELVFHRAFTHSLTGRRGEVSICALRLGTKELVYKLTAEQIKEKHAKAKEQERKRGIRDSLLKKEKGQ